jgi:hypothetical protein
VRQKERESHFGRDKGVCERERGREGVERKGEVFYLVYHV